MSPTQRWYVLIAVMAGNTVRADDCVRSEYYRQTDDFYLAAAPTSGAPGEVVAVDVYLTVENLRPSLVAFTVIVCHDPGLVLIDKPILSAELEEISFATNFFVLGTEPAPLRPSGGPGFTFDAILRVPEGVEKYFTTPEPFHVVTVFFRIAGNPGDTLSFHFCDDEFEYDPEENNCLFSYLYYIPSIRAQLIAGSTRHSHATVRVTDPRATKLGDTNFDDSVDLSDAVALLRMLFLGERSACVEASDFNLDGMINVSDAVAILRYLFLGSPPPIEREVLCSE